MPRQGPAIVDLRANPLGLSERDRILGVDLINSMRRSRSRLTREREIALGYWKELGHHDHLNIFEQVENSLLRQLRGQQKGPGRYFSLQRDVPADDMAYVLQSLGVPGD